MLALKSVVLFATFMSALCALPMYEGAAKSPRPPVGTALGPVTGSHTNCPWTNLIRCASNFVVKTADNKYVDPKTVTLREDGYPAGLPEGRVAVLTVHASLSGHYPSGQYTLEFQGTGKITVSGDAASTEATTSPMSFAVTPANAGVIVTITSSNSANPIHTMALRLSTHVGLTLEPSWHNLAKGFSAFSFVHWQQEKFTSTANTYSAPNSLSWSQRAKESFFTYATKDGVPHEIILETLRLLPTADALVAVPQFANEEYIQQMATLYASGLGTARTLYVIDSFAPGFLNDPTPRVARLKLIHKVFSAAFAAKSPSPTLKVILTCKNGDICANLLKFLEPTSKILDNDFKKAVAAVAIPAETLAGEGSEYLRLQSYQDDVMRIAREQMWEDEIRWYSFASRLSLLDLPLLAYEGGPLLAVPMYNNVFRRPNSVEATIEKALSTHFEKFEVDNNAGLTDLWVEFLERWYRNGGGLVMAGQMVSQGFACKESSGGGVNIEGINSNQCNYRGLTRWVDAAGTANKLKGVKEWVSDKQRGASYLRVSSPAALPVCNPACRWGHCSMEGKCICDHGYTGVSCDVFSASALPNNCSPDDYGANIGFLSDWQSVWIWSDFMNFARTWIHQPISGHGMSLNQPNMDFYGWVWSYDNASKLQPVEGLNLRFDSNGYPVRLGPNDGVSTFLRRDTYEYPHGLFHVFYEGDGTLLFGMDTHVVRRVRPGYIIVETRPVKQMNNGLWFHIARTNPEDYVRNVHVVPDSMLGRYRVDPFHPLFLQSLERYKSLRFMSAQNPDGGYMKTTPEPLTWSQRTPPSYFSQTSNMISRDGISIEHIVALSNRLHVHPWICLPFHADDGYVRAQAQYVKTNLNPKLRPIIEYSNEVWADHNYVGFYATDQGVKAGLADGHDIAKARACWNQRRSRQIWKIYQGEGVTITRVLSGQSGSERVLQEALRCEPNVAAEVDMLSIAPYLGVDLMGPTRLMTLEEVFSRSPDHVNQSATTVVAHVALAKAYGIKQVSTYEAGPAYFGGAKGDDPDVQNLGLEVHRSPKMVVLVNDYFTALRKAGVTLNMYFLAPAGQWSKYGAFSMREYQNQDPQSSYKVQGYEAYAKSQMAASCAWPPYPTACTCNGHGFCLSDGRCECYMGYRGDACTEQWFIPNIERCNKWECGDNIRNGTCQATKRNGFFEEYTCVGCNQGWVGWHCHVPVCPNNCNYNGRCASPGQCKCFRGHMGAACDMDCGCSGHGACTGTGECTCDAGYTRSGKKCVPSCNCPTCLAPNICGCDTPCVFGKCWDGKCQCWSGYGGATCANKEPNAAANSDSPAGMNVAPISDWASGDTFLNSMFRSRKWFLNPAKVDEPSDRWTVNEEVTLTRDGYPAFLPKDRVAGTFAYRDTKRFIPPGRYHVLYDGDGLLDFAFDAKVIESTEAKGYMVIDFRPSLILDNGMYIRIVATNPSNPIRNIRIYPDAYPHDAYAKTFVFHPTYLDSMKSYRTIRFHNWANLEYPFPQNRTWRKRKLPSDASMTTLYGVSEELMIDLCNTLGADMWLNVPHDAEDDYVRKLAQLIRIKLRPDVAIYIEHSNEVWNTYYESHKYSLAMGTRFGPSGISGMEAAMWWHGTRSQKIFSIFQEEFDSGEHARLRFELGTFALIPTWTLQALRHIKVRPLSLAITTYFCDENTFGGSGAAMMKSSAQMVSECRAKMSDTSYFDRHFELARTNGLTVDAYEGGPALVQWSAMMGGYARPGVFETYNAVHRDPAMRSIVNEYLTSQAKLGIRLNMWFCAAYESSIYGSFGIKESIAEPCSAAPKCAGLQDWINANRNSSLRAVTWSLAAYGIRNSISATFAASPTPQEVFSMERQIEKANGWAEGVVTAVLPQSSSPSTTSQHHAVMHMAQSGVKILFIIRLDKTTSSNVESLTTSLLQSVKAMPNVKEASIQEMVGEKKVNPNGPLPPQLFDDGSTDVPMTVAPGATQPPGPTVVPGATPALGPTVAPVTTVAPGTPSPGAFTGKCLELSKQKPVIPNVRPSSTCEKDSGFLAFGAEIEQCAMDMCKCLGGVYVKSECSKTLLDCDKAECYGKQARCSQKARVKLANSSLCVDFVKDLQRISPEEEQDACLMQICERSQSSGKRCTDSQFMEMCLLRESSVRGPSIGGADRKAFQVIFVLFFVLIASF